MLITILKKTIKSGTGLAVCALRLSALTHRVFSPNLPLHHLSSSLCSLIFILIAAVCSLPASILPSGLFSVAAAAACMRSDRHLICLTVPLWSHYSLSWPLCSHLISAVSYMNTPKHKYTDRTRRLASWHEALLPCPHAQALTFNLRASWHHFAPMWEKCCNLWLLICVTFYAVDGDLMMITVTLQRAKGHNDLTPHQNGSHCCKLGCYERGKHF